MEDYLTPKRFATQDFGFIRKGRRFACDRCRAHKLRCERVLWSLEPTACRRCQRAKVMCTITPKTQFPRRMRNSREQDKKIDDDDEEEEEEEAAEAAAAATATAEVVIASTASTSRTLNNITGLNLKGPRSVVEADHNVSLAPCQVLPRGTIPDGPRRDRFSPFNYVIDMELEESTNVHGLYPRDFQESFAQIMSMDRISGLITPPSTDNDYELGPLSQGSTGPACPKLKPADWHYNDRFLHHGNTYHATIRKSGDCNEPNADLYRTSSTLAKQLILLDLNRELVKALDSGTKPQQTDRSSSFHPISQTPDRSDYPVTLYSSLQQVISLSASYLAILRFEKEQNQAIVGTGPSTTLLMVNNYLTLITLCERRLFEALDHLILSPRWEMTTATTAATTIPLCTTSDSTPREQTFSLRQTLEKELVKDLRRLVVKLQEIERCLHLPKKHCVIGSSAGTCLKESQPNMTWSFLLDFFSSPPMVTGESGPQRTDTQSLRNIILVIEQLLVGQYGCS